MQLFEPASRLVRSNKTQSGPWQPQRIEYAEKSDQRYAQRIDSQSLRPQNPRQINLKDIAERHREDRAGEEHSRVARDVSDLGTKLLSCSRGDVGEGACGSIAHEADLIPDFSCTPVVNQACNFSGRTAFERVGVFRGAE